MHSVSGRGGDYAGIRAGRVTCPETGRRWGLAPAGLPGVRAPPLSLGPPQTGMAFSEPRGPWHCLPSLHPTAARALPFGTAG